MPPDDQPMHPRRHANDRAAFDYVGDKDLKKLQRKAWDAGWWPERRKKGIMWLAPDGVGQVLLHGTSTDHHAYANARARFPGERAGRVTDRLHVHRGDARTMRNDAVMTSREFTITLPFGVRPGDEDGVFIEALLETAIELAPENATGFVAGGDIAKGTVEVVFTLVDCDEDEARACADELFDRVKDAVLSGDGPSVSLA